MSGGLVSTICLILGVLVATILAIPGAPGRAIFHPDRERPLAFLSPALLAAFFSGFGASGLVAPTSPAPPAVNFLRQVIAGALVAGFVYAAERLVTASAAEPDSAGDEADLDLAGSGLRERLEDESAQKKADVGTHLGGGDGPNG